MKTNGLEILSEKFKCFGFPKCIKKDRPSAESSHTRWGLGKD
jgi:hypothetical protein